MQADPLQPLLERLETPLERPAAERLRRYLTLLLEWNHRAHLVSGRDAHPDALARHTLEALQALPFLPRHGRLVDVGTGGGFPGLVWACLQPARELVLVEGNRRKCAFLREVIRALALARVTVLCRRLQQPAQLAAVGGCVWTSRAAGCAALLLEAGRTAPAGPLRLVLYVGSDWDDRTPDRAWQAMESLPLVSGVRGRLLILDRRASPLP